MACCLGYQCSSWTDVVGRHRSELRRVGGLRVSGRRIRRVRVRRLRGEHLLAGRHRVGRRVGRRRGELRRVSGRRVRPGRGVGPP